jgi:hypothetical protein
MKGIKEPVEKHETFVKDNGCIGTRVYHSYVVLLTEKDGSEVKAVRFSTTEKKGNDSFAEAFHEEFPEWEDWNVKGTWRLYEDDFRK